MKVVPKTKPVGVRFNQAVFNSLKEKYGIRTVHQALIFLENFWLETFRNNQLETQRVHRAFEKKISQQPETVLIDLKPETPPSALPPEHPSVNNDLRPVQLVDPDVNKKIEAILAQRIPPERDTLVGRKVWKKEQAKKIKNLKTYHEKSHRT